MQKKILLKLKGLLNLMRFNKPIGTLLLLWPTLTAFLVLTNGNPQMHLLLLFSIGTFLMRSAGCVINDFFDKDLDGKVERTKKRPLVTGEVLPNEALFLFLILLILSAILLLWMNQLTLIIATIGALIACLYPLTKRFFSLPQIFLGFAFSWGIVMVSAAELNTISNSALMMFAACFFWILAYDTAYAMCDKEDDKLIGIKSSALTFGENVKLFIFIFHSLSLLIWSFVGFFEDLGLLFFLSLFVALLLVFYQMYLIKDYDKQKCFQAFKSNNWIGILILLGAVLST
jgi:4-hydroxybenzoate polyprenyltransferase